MPKNLLLNCFLGMRRLFTTLYIYISLLLMCAFSAKAQDSIRVSLLTCEPGTEIYALFGHTALRFEDPSRDIDWVFQFHTTILAVCIFCFAVTAYPAEAGCLDVTVNFSGT